MTSLRRMRALFPFLYGPAGRAISAISAILAGVASASGLLAGCDDPAPPPPVRRPPSASAAPLYVPPPPEGCTRTGSLEGVEGDPACVVRDGDDTTMRTTMKHLRFALVPDRSTVTAGGTVIVRLTITNAGASEVALVLDAEPRGAAPRPDWTRLAGVPEPKPVASGMPGPERFRLHMPMRTLDSNERSVDGLPTKPSTSTAAPRSLRVRLRAGGKLTHVFTWWALRIPAPGPITRDDAGHRFVPKTAPVPLQPGEYVVAVQLPLHGIAPPESIVSTRMQVDKPNLSRDR